MISHEFLGHQIEDTKELANYYQTLNNFKNDALGSYMFDKNLWNCFWKTSLSVLNQHKFSFLIIHLQ